MVKESSALKSRLDLAQKHGIKLAVCRLYVPISLDR